MDNKCAFCKTEEGIAEYYHLPTCSSCEIKLLKLLNSHKRTPQKKDKALTRPAKRKRIERRIE